MLGYKSGIAEVLTKITILRDEFDTVHDTSPIEHVGSRLKSPESLLAKVRRKACPMTLEAIRAQIWDIAGVRVTCSFVSDIYRIRDLLVGQPDLTVLAERDYIAEPKPNGYQSLHLIVTVPVFLSDRVEHVTVEIQIRTIAMDFWASLEHKIYYKYDGAVPQRLLAELKDAALAASRLDATMEQLHDEVRALAAHPGATGQGTPVHGTATDPTDPTSDLLVVAPEPLSRPGAPSDEVLAAFAHLLQPHRPVPGAD
ncbi:GTP pyrophosphokinase [Cellulomonas soli]|uniref:GTP pyrophosphokinase n=1 Tax=Cellulomonas soli TaxID=931535 RepID=A0A512PAG8_9CELL|nr:GTP pyrophosphokinase family protein [Cellulomonas soli]NYI60692.1 putative GTP pyrophosphokinase [Cellulomonas soli]GEP68207.1 GTP pyrophosphokinase [Cellulomonas soli]